jgi:hypothetical protein
MRKKLKKLIIFITGLHNKPQGCGASVASAAAPFTSKKDSDVDGDNVLYVSISLPEFRTNP